MTTQPSPQSPAAVGPPRSVVIGTAGHIDHGKTALIRALTGVDTDRLPEEKRRGITVDLGFASMQARLADSGPLLIGFIDVPGHAQFVRNMLAGAGGIDAVLLVVSAEEGVKPQTEEHLAICSLLGIEHGLTVLTKIDAVSDARWNTARRAVAQFLAGTFLDPKTAPIVPVSAHSGAGMDALRQALIALAARIPARNAGSLARLPIDRAFAMKGFGTVVTGTLISGSLKTGQSVAIEPGQRSAKIRGIQVHGHALQTVVAGTRVALNLAGVEVAELQRGDTLVEPGSIAAVEWVDAAVELLPAAPSLKHRAAVHFHAFASECMAAVSLYGYQAVAPGTSRLARFRLSRPVVLLPGDRFVIRQGTPLFTVGGGRILDVRPVARLKRSACHAWLQELRNAAPEEQIGLRIARRGTAGIALRVLAVETGMKSDVLLAGLAGAIEAGRVSLLPGDLLLSRDALDAAAVLVQSEFERRVKSTATCALKQSELKSQTHLAGEVFDLVLRWLESEGKLRLRNESIETIGGGDRSGIEAARLAAIEAAFESAGLGAPSGEELAARLEIPPAEMRRLITLLLREKVLVRLGSDSLFVHRRAAEGLKETVRALHGQPLDVARFKQLAGVSRKYAIPLLEYLDRERITRRQDDTRVVL